MSLSEKDIEALKVAWLVASKRKQADIMEDLNLPNQPAVHRAKKLAKRRGWLTYSIDWPQQLDDSKIQEIKDAGFSNRKPLEAALDLSARSRNSVSFGTLHVVDVDDGGDDGRVSEQFGSECAKIVGPMLIKSRYCGVSWGRTVLAICHALGAVRYPRADAVIFPVAGEPLNFRSDLSSSAASLILTQLLNSKMNSDGKKYELILHGIPARIPKNDFGIQDAMTIKKFVNCSDAYQDIFKKYKSGKPLVERMDMLLTGIGNFATSTNDAWFKDFLQMEGEEARRYITPGNIGGVWLEDDKSTQSEKDAIKSVNERWLGIKKSHIVECGKRATKSGAPGVVVLATGADKSTIAQAVMGYVNHLVIDRSLASALASAYRL